MHKFPATMLSKTEYDVDSIVPGINKAMAPFLGETLQGLYLRILTSTEHLGILHT